VEGLFPSDLNGLSNLVNMTPGYIPKNSESNVMSPEILWLVPPLIPQQYHLHRPNPPHGISKQYHVNACVPELRELPRIISWDSVGLG